MSLCRLWASKSNKKYYVENTRNLFSSDGSFHLDDPQGL